MDRTNNNAWRECEMLCQEFRSVCKIMILVMLIAKTDFKKQGASTGTYRARIIMESSFSLCAIDDSFLQAQLFYYKL
jgi:hypothetical protein